MGSPRTSQPHSYELVRTETGERTQFQAANVSDALLHAQSLMSEGEPATLAEDGIVLAHLTCSSNGFWGVDTPLPVQP
jgi:hypothetical protein